MPLPILQSANVHGSADLVRLFHHTELQWARHLSEETPLEAGVAFANPELPRVWDANRVLDAAVPAGSTPEELVAEAESFFAERGTPCAQWTMNPSAPAERAAPLIRYLESSGWRADPADIFYLPGRPPAPIREAAGLTIIPARASFRHWRELAEEWARCRAEPQLADAAMLHLDDPHYDAMLALRDGKVAGRAGVLAVGDVGRIDQVYVAEAFRRQGVGRTLMSRALEICARSLFRHVMLSRDPANDAARGLYEGIGFQKIGEIVSYRR
jgi:ribosomal protein S18 acetylase RimI-like enzyme